MVQVRTPTYRFTSESGRRTTGYTLPLTRWFIHPGGGGWGSEGSRAIPNSDPRLFGLYMTFGVSLCMALGVVRWCCCRSRKHHRTVAMPLVADFFFAERNARTKSENMFFASCYQRTEHTSPCCPRSGRHPRMRTTHIYSYLRGRVAKFGSMLLLSSTAALDVWIWIHVGYLLNYCNK